MSSLPHAAALFAGLAGALAALIPLAGVVILAWLAVNWRRAVATPAQGGLAAIRRRGVDARDAIPVLLLAVAIGLPSALASSAPPPASQKLAAGAWLLPLLLQVLMVALAVVCARQTPAGGIRRSFGLAAGAWPRCAARGAVYGLALVPASLLAQWATSVLLTAAGLPPEPQPALELLADPAAPWILRAGIAAGALTVAPLAEEALFRGVLLAALLARLPAGRALLWQALLFAAVHGHGPSFTPLAVAGAAFGAGYCLTGSLATPIAMHIVFNAASLALLLGR